MKSLLLLCILVTTGPVQGQLIDSLNTAKNCSYMKPEEREMLYEINCVRSNPRSYLQYIEPLLARQKKVVQASGKGEKNYSVTYSTTTINGKETRKTDTVWHYINQEELKALTSLVNDLKKMKPASVLQPDSGIYNAAMRHTNDQNKHQWTLLHTGSDGSGPWDRIRQCSPSMAMGNENIAGRYPEPSAREIVLQLLIDSGIPGYGHRYNLLDAQWTHGACVTAGKQEGMYRWIQNFGRKAASY
jgi:uncharacterized protein YkwD